MGPETKDLAPTWEALAERADGLAAEERALQRKVNRARAAEGLADVAWDDEEGAFGRAVLDASGGKRDQLPYTRFYRKASPSKVKTFGRAREVAFGRDTVTELGREADAPLAKAWIPRLTAVTDALESAGKVREKHERSLAMHQVTAALFVEDLNRELDVLEGELMKRFPRQPGRVAAHLAPTRPLRKSRAQRGGEEPAAPAAPVAGA